MPSSFAWVDFSEAERRRTQEVLELFHERDTRDELGIGVVRDALGDLLFPGTSTLQTRARYFLFVPWMYQRLAEKGVGRTDVDWRARKAELDLIQPLKANDDQDGVIGAVAEDQLKRLPSSVYWAGLGVWGVRRFPGSQAQYHHSFDVLGGSADLDDDGVLLASRHVVWDPDLPPKPNDFPEVVSFRLTRPEAQYLQHRAQNIGPSLLAELVRRGTGIEAVDFPWQRSDVESWPEDLQEQLNHARCFSEAMHGAALLYNLMLAEALKDEELSSAYREGIQAWRDLMQTRRSAHAAWRRDAFWALVLGNQTRISPRSRAFIDAWLDVALSDGSPDVAGSSSAREMIRRREEQLKRGRARLGNPSALARWSGSAGAAQLNYRWPRVQAITSDILQGLVGEG